ncbi:uncharacterized protein C6orf15 homolog [Perognathus longimembris pacificus]|uniref:uncharacterized protein C6orf15 homolog n=1 Tax=Perognathus longimembris pacificus TaxID=214514 RepID=UPI00201852E9|nr:uncharacterized protein C6orf15 homolog [Perognathus longimembris pacificus]
MQGWAVRSGALLGLLLVCLHLPGFLARSIGTKEETDLPLLEHPSFTSSFNSGQPQPKADPGPNALVGAAPTFNGPPPDAPLPPESSGVQNWPPSWGLPDVEYWPSEYPWQMMAAEAENSLEQAMPEGLPYLSGGDAVPLATGPLPEASSALPEQPSDASYRRDPQPRRLLHPRLLGPRRPPWLPIHRPGFPLGTWNPSVAWGGGGRGTGWGTRPMPYPSGAWGINNRFPGTGGGIINRYPVGSWGNVNPYPGGSWGINSRYPGTGWEISPLKPGINNQFPPKVPRPSGSPHP